MVNKPQKIGTAAETAARRLIQSHGFPKADRRPKRGNKDEGDLLLCDGVIAEVKVRNRTISLEEIAGWMLETQTEVKNARADYGFLIVRKFYANVSLWPCYWLVRDIVMLHMETPEQVSSDYLTPRTAIASMTLIDSVMMLRHCGYGEEP